MKYRGKQLTKKVFDLIQKNWPIHPSGVCRLLDIETNVSNISKIKYHYGLLKKKGVIHTKQIDRALVAWPSEIDRIRMVHEFMNGI